MSKTIEFLFDVGSPFSWLAYHRLPTFAQEHGASIIWTPVLVAGIFQATGNRSPVEVPTKAMYTLLDLQRWARAFNVNFQMNPAFPIHTLQLMRCAVALQMQDEAAFQRYLAAIFHAMFEQPRNLGEPTELASVLSAAGFDPMQLLAMTADQAVKDKLKENTAQAVARGAFGVPTFFVGEQMFWGQDRFDFVAQALAQA